MKILVMSDSHRDLTNARNVIKTIGNQIDLIIHLGDCEDDVKQLMIEYPDYKFEYVVGNCDYDSDYDVCKLLKFEKVKIFMTHGHRYSVKWGYDRISYAGEEKGADIVLFGHTHMPAIENFGKIKIMNPGSISQPRGIDIPSYGIINIDDYGITDMSIVGIYNKNDFRVLNLRDNY